MNTLRWLPSLHRRSGTLKNQTNLLVNSCRKHCPNVITSFLASSSTTVANSTTATTAPSSFFTYTSGRARRRTRRLNKQQHRLPSPHDSEDAESDPKQQSQARDDRTVMDILFPNPYKGEEDPDKIVWPTTFTAWKTALAGTWTDYRSTWDGFWTSKGFLVEDPPETKEVSNDNNATEQQQPTPGNEIAILDDKQQQQVVKNVQRNVVFLTKASTKLKDEIQKQTGIYNKEDLRNYTADMMRLGSDCVQQFMAGYRKGRDDEVEKMLTQYFQELQVAAAAAAATDTKPRRRRKRRIINRFASVN